MTLQISAVICTYNRAEYLRECLRSLIDQSLSRDRYEIIVVDNASTDNTRGVFEERSDVDNLRYIYEPIIGLSRARNTAYQHARGTYVAFLDDDAVATADWLARYVEAFETLGLRPGCIGGKCELIWETPRPDWLSDNTLSYLSFNDYSDVPIVLNEKQWVSGCNMAVPRALLQKAGGFREGLGRQGNNLRANEEACLRRQLDALGYCTVYHPGIVVGHRIVPARLTKEWFRRAGYWQGLSDFLVDHANGPLSGFDRALLAGRRLGWLLPRATLMLVAATSATRFDREMQVRETMGYIAGIYGKK